MTTSIIEAQRNIILQNILKAGQTNEGNWRVLVCDELSKTLLDNVTTSDDVLDVMITGVELLHLQRESQPTADVVYFLTPTLHVVKTLEADLQRKRYNKAYIIWTSSPQPDVLASYERTNLIPQQSEILPALNVEFFPLEPRLITLGQSYSFQVLFNRQCDALIKGHLDELARKIVSVCVTLDEYPLVRYYRPRNANHDAAVLCTYLANFVQEKFDHYAGENQGFPPPSPRPRAVLLITDRTMDLMAPLVHELTYQAMAMDLLPFDRDPVLQDKVVYEKPDSPDDKKTEEERKKEKNNLTEKDKLWVENRHLHMKDLLVKLSADFKKFQAKNPQFADNSNQNISVNTIKDMLAGLPEFKDGKAAFSLHIDIAEKCATQFQDQKLMDVTSLEQSLATGLDEDNQKPKNVTDQMVRLLADESLPVDARARLLMLYIVYRGGIQDGDIRKLQMHGGLTNQHKETVYNLQALGARTLRQLGDNTNHYQRLYPAKETIYSQGEELSLSRFEPMLRYALEELCQGQLDNNKFPPTKPHLDNQGQQQNTAQTLRSAGKATWASTRPAANKPRQRIIVFMAGGATYSEARMCYEISQQAGKEIFLTTTQMLTPQIFMREAARLHMSRKELQLPIDQRPKVPVWLKDPPPGSAAPQQQPSPRNGGVPSGTRPPTAAMQNMSMGSSRPQNSSSRPGTSQTATPSHAPGSFSSEVDHNSGKLKKDKKEKKDKNLLDRFRRH